MFRPVLGVTLVMFAAVIPSFSQTAVEEARSALQTQIGAWNQADLEGALKFYWDSPQMTWVNRKGVSRGRDEFAKQMRTDFVDRARMGHYQAKFSMSIHWAQDRYSLEDS